MSLNQKEQSLIQDLQEQEKLCIQKYTRYVEQAHDQELKNLFDTLRENEINHYKTLEQLKKDSTTQPDVEHLDAAKYCPKSTYTSESNSREKEDDAYLCTDSIATEKMISTSYNEDLFQFSSTAVRDTLNQIQTDEQNHGEMIYKYKTANGMA